MLLAWRFSRTFASRFNFANVVFFLLAKVDLHVVQRKRTYRARRRRAEHSSPVGGRTTPPGEARPVPPERVVGPAPRRRSSYRRPGTASHRRSPVATRPIAATALVARNALVARVYSGVASTDVQPGEELAGDNDTPVFKRCL